MTTNFGGVDVVPLQGAIVGCHCSVLWLELGEWTWCAIVLCYGMVGCHVWCSTSVERRPATFGHIAAKW